jgi:CubicO group peptidase (beta-lactamase class C family)
MAVAVINHGKGSFVQAYGIRTAKGDPLLTNSIMYGPSFTKTGCAYTVMQLVDQNKLNLHTRIKDNLDNPMPTYGSTQSCPTSMERTRISLMIVAGNGSRRVCA